MFRHIVLILNIIVCLCACGTTARMTGGISSFTDSVRGEYYLDSKKYDAGIGYFTSRLSDKPQSASVRYYLGRLYLAKNDVVGALDQFMNAVLLAPDKTDHHFWLGVTYGAHGQPDVEKKSYERALALNPKHLQALIYSGHNRLENGQYGMALEFYERALKRQSRNPSALYASALVLKKMGRKGEEIQRWKRFLSMYPSGAPAVQATRHLNSHGDFSYRNHRIGPRVFTMKQIEFNASTDVVSKESRESLVFVGKIIRKNEKLLLHVVVFQENNAGLAKARAKSIKNYICQRYPDIDVRRIRLSWFGETENLQGGKTRVSLAESVNIFTEFSRLH
ncbi:MAG: tetratricopeptide repeat protein [Desulfobacteraceae bacterium]|nr:tetratricopeptide repeat protein [Desulfobacteraceae bacterium]